MRSQRPFFRSLFPSKPRSANGWRWSPMRPCNGFSTACPLLARRNSDVPHMVQIKNSGCQLLHRNGIADFFDGQPATPVMCCPAAITRKTF